MKNFKKLIAIALSAITAFGLTGCSVGGNQNEDYDPSKTQLVVGYFSGGYGNEWLYKAKTMFEEAMADYSFEPGKKGVQLDLRTNKEEYRGWNFVSGFAGREEDIYIGAELFHTLQNETDLMRLDVVDDKSEDTLPIIDQPLTEFGETKTIREKMTDAAKTASWYNDPNVPTFFTIFAEGYFGQLVYDMDLFEEKGYYMAQNGGYTTGKPGAPEKSIGFDEIRGTYDDGLPVTEDDFFNLCKLIRSKGDIPMTWSGNDASYPIAFGVQLSINYDDAKAQEIWRTGKGSYILYHKDGNNYVPDDQPTEFNGVSNFYECARFPGKLAALRSIKKLISDTSNYSSSVYKTSQNNIKAQNEYLSSVMKGQQIAMLIEGGWWETEASAMFESMALEDEKYAMGNRNFGIMPLYKIPDITTNRINAEKHSYMTGYSPIFISQRAKHREAAKMFMKFLATDKFLEMFTATSGVPAGYNYEISDETYDSLTTYKKQLWDIHVDKDGTHILTSENRDWHPMFKLQADHYPYAFSSNVNEPTSYRSQVSDPFAYFYQNWDKTAEEYYDGMLSFAHLIAEQHPECDTPWKTN